MRSPVEPPLSAEQQTSFLTLPREIRDTIYELALVNPSPIVVWSAKLRKSMPWGRPRFVWVYSLDYNREAIASSVRNLMPNIILCNRTVALEASSIFYGKNTFSFQGDHDWIPVITWLHAIGGHNRVY